MKEKLEIEKIQTEDELDKWVQKNILTYYYNDTIQKLVKNRRYTIIANIITHKG